MLMPTWLRIPECLALGEWSQHWDYLGCEDVCWSKNDLEKGMANHFTILALRTPGPVWKGKKNRTLKDKLPRSVGSKYATGDQWRDNFRMSRRSQSNNTQLWMWLVMQGKSDAVKSNIAKEPGMLGPWIKANWKWSNRRWQEWTPTF